jgi:AcrR family transcriptional regulator
METPYDAGMPQEHARPLSYRQMQAQATKDRIVAAARALMSERGWDATTIAAIAAEAGVAPQTVYATFGSKLAIVDGMRKVMMRDAQIPQLMAEAASEGDPRRRLEFWARSIRQQLETSYDVIAIHRQAARSNPDFDVEYRKVLDNRSRHFREFVHALGGALGNGLDERTAVDILWALANEELYRELVMERGWTPERYEQWLARTLISQLLG